MKKWIALFLIVVMTMSLLACSKQDPEVQEQTATVEHVWDGTTPPVEGFQVGCPEEHHPHCGCAHFRHYRKLHGQNVHLCP